MYHSTRSLSHSSWTQKLKQVTIYSITLWRSTSEYVVEIAKSTDEITIAIGQSVKTVTYDDGYKELEKRILSAQKEILILTDYIFDWERGKPIWDPERTNSPQRKSFYALLQKTLKRQKNNRDFRFVKIVQIPEQHSINEVLKFDPLYAEDCQSIIDIAKNETEFACLKVAPKIFSNSIIIIDKEFAHISFDIHSPKENEVDAPFVMLIQDPTSVSLVNVHKLYKRIEAHSSLVTKLVY